MKPAKRQKNYEVTRDGCIHVYPSMGERKGRRMYAEIAVLLRGATKNLASLIRGKGEFGPLK
jgi:hypothetical protein